MLKFIFSHGLKLDSFPCQKWNNVTGVTKLYLFIYLFILGKFFQVAVLRPAVLVCLKCLLFLSIVVIKCKEDPHSY